MFIDEYTKIRSFKEKERFILKSLTSTKDGKIRKTKSGWTVTFSWGLKWFVEFSEENTIYLDENINGTDILNYPRYIYIYKEKFGECIKEIVLTDVFDSAYRTYKILKD